MSAARAIPQVPDVMSAGELLETAQWLASLQRCSGLIPWFEGGHGDPWNHVEAAMALATAGRFAEAELAYDWLVSSQRADGAWHNYYVAGGDRVEVPSDVKLDTNVCAYVATGAWHHWMLTRDRGFVETMWPVVERALDFVLSMRRPDGAIVWARYPHVRPWNYALLTGSSSIVHSMRCALGLADVLGKERPQWEEAADRLAALVASDPSAFEPKDRWSMDWYYPVLAGIVTNSEGAALLKRRYDDFALDDCGIRCVNDQPWVTAAETSECAIAHCAVGALDTACDLFGAAQRHRLPDGSYYTGIVYPNRDTFPHQERTSYTAAAVILAADALSSTTTASGLFVDPPPHG